MKVIKLSQISSYKIQYDLFRYGEYYQKDIAAKNRFYNKLYACIDDKEEVLALAYIGQEKGSVYFDCMSVRKDLTKQGIGTFFVQEIKKIFPNVPIKALPQDDSMSFWLKNGFKPKGSGMILVYEPPVEVSNNLRKAQEN